MDIKPDHHVGMEFKSSGTRDIIAYAIEVRSTYRLPFKIDNLIVDDVWRRVSFELLDIKTTVYNSLMSIEPNINGLGLFSYETAEALRNTFISYCWFQTQQAISIETRLIKVRLITSFKEVEIGVSEPEISSVKLRNMKFTPRYDNSEVPDKVEDKISVTSQKKMKRKNRPIF